ncbi:hypothetical protein L1S32_06155 [Methanogenium sp. S4BF]|uniref:hypothetical protein n=1 Tax=Methanogenium sp. S4BF TaxID=1789226 RepID=UPI002415AEF9|nr:hypothetical protein [Methanogenium sp. S4BF]WFN33441.1 hypothetical protein L1S32_06155 [Methanogenium sp. S4BF]
MQTEPGTLSPGNGGGLCLALAEETYRLARDDIHTLLFYGQSVPLTRTERQVHPDGTIVAAAVIDGHIAVHVSGRAVLITTRAGLYSIPFVSFQRVARGEAASAPLFPAMPAYAGGCR